MPQVEFPHEQPKWNEIAALLTALREPLPLDEVFNKLAAIHGVKCNLKESPPLEDTPFGGLFDFVNEYAEDEEKDKFLKTVIPTIAILALDIKKNTPVGGLRYSSKNKFKTTPFNRKFVASLLACGFLCLFPEEFKPESATGINFDWFFDILREVQEQHEKLRCILHYFERMSVMYRDLNESITFTRVFIPENRLFNKEILQSDDSPLSTLSIFSHIDAHDIDSDVLLVSFSNKFIGGGVLDRGCHIEEIRYVACPELIAGLLFVEAMDKTECVLISGFEQFSETSGVGKRFSFEGPHQAEYERDIEGNFDTALVAIDYKPYQHTREGLKEQFTGKGILREINKAYVGFCQPGTTGSTRNGVEWLGEDRDEITRIYPIDIRAVATGNWGCGSLGGGDYQLKAMIQWLAASLSKVPEVKYYTERKKDLDHLELIKQDMMDNKWTIGRLSRELFKFSNKVEMNKDKGYGLFVHLEEALEKDKKKEEKKGKCVIL